MTLIFQRLIGQLNHHLHNLQTINNGCYITITVTVTVNKYHRGHGISEVMLFGTCSVFLMNFPGNNAKDKMFRTGSKQMMSPEWLTKKSYCYILKMFANI